MILEYTLELEDNLAWFDLHNEFFPSQGLSTIPLIGKFILAERKAKYTRAIVASENYLALGHRSLEITERGVREFNEVYDFFVRWEEYSFIALGKEHIFLAQPSMNARIVPLRACTNTADNPLLISLVEQYSLATPSIRRSATAI